MGLKQDTTVERALRRKGVEPSTPPLRPFSQVLGHTHTSRHSKRRAPFPEQKRNHNYVHIYQSPVKSQQKQATQSGLFADSVRRQKTGASS